MRTSNKNYFFVVLMLLFLFPACIIEEEDPDPTDLRAKFTGTWRLDETELKSTNTFYDIKISIDPSNSSQVLIQNFGNIGNFYKVYGIVTSSQITIPLQSIASLELAGNGSLSSSTRMNWSYSINDGADLKNYTAIADKQ